MPSDSKCRKRQYILDWFGFDHDWMVGMPAIILLLYGVTIAGIFISNSYEYFWQFGSALNPIWVLLLLPFVPLGYIWKQRKLAENLADVSFPMSLQRVGLSLIWQVMGIFFGVAFGLLGIFSQTIQDPLVYWGFVITNLTFANICFIISKGYTRESPIANFFVRRAWNIINHFGK